MMNKKFSSWPSYTNEEINSVKKVLASNKVNYWTGDECRKFEKEFAEYFDSKYSISLSNGTVAIDLALEVLGIKKGDEVIAASGILGKVKEIKGDYVAIEVSENITFKLQKTAIANTLPKGTIASID